jgi:hypothetical protein
MNIDTHAFVKAFVNAKTDEQKAEIIADIFIKESAVSENKIDKKFERTKDDLSTKSDILLIKKDLKELELSLQKDMASMKVELLKWMFAMMSGQIAIFMVILKFFFKL